MKSTIMEIKNEVQSLKVYEKVLSVTEVTLLNEIIHVASTLTPQSLPQREKRDALIPQIGIIFGSLFGTATENEIKNFQRKLNRLKSWASSRDKVIKQSLLNIENNEKLIIKINERVNDLINTLNRKEETNEIRLKLMATSSLFNLLHSSYTALQGAIATARMGTVSQNLLSVNELFKILHLTNVQKNYVPFFKDEEDTHLYYHLLHSVIIQDQCFITIPFLPSTTNFMYRIHPFPSLMINKTIILDMESILVSMSNTLDNIRVLDNDLVEQLCIESTSLLLICPTHAFPIIKSKENDCIKRLLVHEDSSSCPFKFINITDPKVIYTTSLKYTFLPTTSEVTINCPRQEPSNSKIIGTIAVPHSCSLKSENISIPTGTDFHYRLSLPLINVSHFKVNNLPIPERPKTVEISTKAPIETPDIIAVDDGIMIANHTISFTTPIAIMVLIITALVVMKRWIRKEENN